MDILELTKNIKTTLAKIADICNECGRNNDITLVGASKMTSQDVIDMVDSNRLLSVLGENRVQELVQKYRKGQNFDWHFIGKLQSNKVKYIIDKVTLIHSVDSLSLAKEIDKQAKKHNKIMSVLLQINMGKEETKSGFYIEEIENAICEISALSNVKIKGIMAVMPIASQDKTIALYECLGTKWLQLKDKYSFEYLSCGMTNDYPLAIKYAGSNMVRIGTGIFGKRSNNEQV